MRCDSSKWLVSGVSIVAVSGEVFIYREEGSTKTLPCLPEILELLLKSLNTYC